MKLNFSSLSKNRAGFTLTDLLVVVAVLMVLAALLVPARASSRANSLTAQCLENKRRLAAAWIQYANDHNDMLMVNPGWVGGTMTWFNETANTNTAQLMDPSQSVIAGYVQSAPLFKCPADIYQPFTFNAPRIRSVAMNSSVGGGNCVTRGHEPHSLSNSLTYARNYYAGGSSAPTPPAFVGLATKMSQLNTPGPARIFLILDEHPDSIADATFAHDPGQNRLSEFWRDLPAGYHEGACGVSFVDGHAEIHKWKVTAVSGTPRTLWQVTYDTSSSPKPWTTGAGQPRNPDWEWVEDGMPYQIYAQ